MLEVSKKHNRIYGFLNFEEVEYKLEFGSITSILEDENLSWGAKGGLSYLADHPTMDKFDFPHEVKMELMRFGYLTEVSP